MLNGVTMGFVLFYFISFVIKKKFINDQLHSNFVIDSEQKEIYKPSFYLEHFPSNKRITFFSDLNKKIWLGLEFPF